MITRHARVGALSELNSVIAHEAEPEVEKLAYMSPRGPPPAPLHHSANETTLSNGATVYGRRKVDAVRRIAEIVGKHKTGGEHPGVFNIPRGHWMQISLADDWGKRMPRAKIYLLGPKNREVMDTTFDQLRLEEKLSPATNHTPVAHPVSVVWRTVATSKGRFRKGRTVVDIRGLTKGHQPNNYLMKSQVYPPLSPWQALCYGYRPI